MNRLLILFLIVPIVFVQAQWEILNVGPNGNPRDIDFVGEQDGWIASENSLLKTTDGGESWQELNLNWRLNSIDFVTTQTGWANGYNSGWNEVILKSENGGFNWDLKYQYDGGYTRDIYALSDDTVFAVGTSIISTFNGGETWSVYSPSTQNVQLESIVFFNRQIGIVSGGIYNYPEYNSILLKTQDGGISWQEVIISEFRNIFEMQLINDSILFFSAESDTGRGIQLCMSVDSLKSWNVLNMFENLYFEVVLPFHAISEDSIFAVAGEYNDTTGAYSSRIVKSINSGEDWQIIKELPSWGFNKIFINKNRGHLIGTVGVNGGITSAYGPVIYGSVDAGENWNIKKMSYPYSDLFFVDENKGFVTGGSDDIHFQTGELFITNDGGNSWELSLITGGNSGPIEFANDNVGFLISSQKSIFKTSDSGFSWSKLYSGSNIWDIQFLNENSGWMSRTISNNATILSTNDGGENWESEYSVVVGNSYLGFKCIFMINENFGWAVGDEGIIAKFNDGDWDSIRSFTNLPLNSVFFVDANHGWVSAGYNPENQLLFYTDDGGESWSSKKFDFRIEDLFFQDNNKGWIAGWDSMWKGLVMQSENGGKDWQVLIDSLKAPITSLHFKNGQAWAAGGQGLILHSDDGVNWIEQPNIIPESAKLYQNYPNPFNPKTFINYDLHTSDYVDLSIYNVLGQKVETLVSQKQNAGNYKVEWDAARFASGIYMYQLKTSDGNIQTRKLVVLK
ncbi:MAG: T9SS C-terminal target domain-containing protein [Calditrichaeota bacterium]|nr:MAG: T9SS C-terminal target domain-containing protein [Calditrichota bacterium]MBL1204135.1 T9SS C-terminal target domain-containing protein [Calditrichota bacterium]NOG43966.1 T9SS type A sorting domain-containing protein [Calditrichota bacterium]